MNISEFIWILFKYATDVPTSTYFKRRNMDKETHFKPQGSCFEVNDHPCQFYGEIYKLDAHKPRLWKGTILHNFTKSTPANFVFLPS